MVVENMEDPRKILPLTHPIQTPAFAYLKIRPPTDILLGADHRIRFKQDRGHKPLVVTER